MSLTISGHSVVVAAKDQVSCDLAGEGAILNIKSGVYYGLDPVGARIWSLMQEPREVAEIQNAITDEYEVEPERCARDLVGLLEKLLAEGLIEVKNAVLRLAGVMVIAALTTGPIFAQRETVGVPDDWSHHHKVFSNPGTFGEAVRSGSFEKWNKIVSDPRFAIQQLKRGAHPPTKWIRGSQETTLQRDWSASLGTAGVAPGMYPAKWQFINGPGTPSCSDYVVFGVNKTGVSGSQPNIVGYQNLYVNAGGTGACTGTAPTVRFSYFVGGGTVQTSPVLGLSVDQVAYVESIAGGSKFHVLKGAGTGGSNGTIAAPVAPGTGNTATDVGLVMNGGVSVTRSSPFYDYAHDVAYVGDDSGKLHKFTPVFNGAPAEVVSSGADVWPAIVSSQASKILTAPVNDNNVVFVGDSAGFLYSVNSTTGSGSSGVTTSGHVGSGTGIVDAPMVDSAAGTVYVFVGASVVNPTNSAVVVFNVSSGNIGSGTTGTAALVGTNSATVPLYDGDFDHIYFTSSNFAQPAGNLYVCGNPGGNPTLYQIPITYSGGPVLGSVVTGPVLASSNVGCSPLTEFFNSSTNTDWLFAGVGSTSCGASGATQGGCVMSFNITSGTAPTVGPWTPSSAFALNSEVVDTGGRLQKCTGGGCNIAGSTSGNTTPAWTSTTTTDGTTANASAVGTVSANSAIGGATVTIGTLTLKASAPTAASSPILILSEPVAGARITINGTVYDWRAVATNCNAGQKCVFRTANTTTEATNLVNAIKGISCFGSGACPADPTVTASASGSTVTVTAITPGTGANTDVLATSNTAAIHINGGAHASTTLGANNGGLTGTPGTNGSNIAPNFQYWGGAAGVTTAVLAANIAAAITPAEQTAAGITLSYTPGNSFFTITGAGSNAGAAGNSVAVGGSLTGFAWSPTGHLAGGNNALTWTSQGVGNGQTTASEATGTSAIIIDNAGTGVGEANIYFGTLSGTGTTNSGVKMTQSGLQ
jgi:hypothetical protein